MPTCQRLALLALCVCLAVPVAAVADTPLPRDPNNTYGQYENGLKYIIRSHANPPDRVIVYLHVDTGALNEKEDQNGIAHYLEHMCFNGSKHFGPGELVKELSKMGVEFGRDLNAHTGQGETAFTLSMPDTKPETIETALKVLSDYASGLTLSQEEVDKERDVILAEARARKGAGERIGREERNKVFAGTRYAAHDIIGDEEQIAKWNKDQFDDFWNTWYRPELMTFVVVGDVDAEKMIEMGRKYLGTFKARAPEREPGKTMVKPVKETRAFVITDPEEKRGRVELMSIQPGRPAATTYEAARAEGLEDIANWMLGRRFEEMVNNGTASFLGAGVFGRDIEHEALVPMGIAVGQPEDWNKMLEQLIVEVDRVIEHGFTKQEYELAKRGLIAISERAVETEPTRDASRIMGSILQSVGDGTPPMSAQQELELTKKLLDDVKLEEIEQAFRKRFETEHYTYVLVLPSEKEGMTIPTSTDVLAAAAEAWAQKTEPKKEAKAVDAILEKLPEPGKVASKETDADLKINTITFENGVVMHHRFMDYKKDEVLVTITLPGGSIEETKENHGVSSVASLAFQQPATSRLDSTQIRDMMLDKKIRVGGGIGEDTLTLSVSGSPADLDFGLQLTYALLTDGKVEQSALDSWKKAMLQRLEIMKTIPQGVMIRDMEKVLYGGDVRMAMLNVGEVEKMTTAMGEACLRKIADNAAIEISVVGQISEDDAIKAIAQYFGSLPKRKGGFHDLDKLRTIKREDGPYTCTTHFDSITDKAVVRAGFVGCESSNVLDRRLLQMASQIVGERMIKDIREEQQLVYSIHCENSPAEAFRGDAFFGAAAPTDPAKTDRLAESIFANIQKFGDEGPTEEELAAAKKQIGTNLDEALREPGFWASLLSDMIYRGRTLDELKQLPEVYQNFTAKQLQDAVKRYFKDDRKVCFIAIPDKPEPKETEKTEEKAPAAVGG